MKRKKYKKRKKRKKIFYFSLYSLKHDLKVLLHRCPKRKCCMFIIAILTFLILTMHTNKIIAVFSKTLQDDEGKSIFYANENTFVEKSENSFVEEEPLLTISDLKEPELINTQNVKYKSDAYYKIENHFDANTDLSKLKNHDYLKNNLYIVDKETDLTSDVFDIDKFLSTNLKLDNTNDVKVLIFNTHASEIYKDSNGTNEGVVGLSYELQRILEQKYGIKSMVHNGVYDMVDGKTQILGAYQRMSPNVEKILKENPSIEVCIDIHRDGLPDDVKLISQVNGKPTAQVMFVNGLSKVYKDGVLVTPPDIPNPNLQTNLAFSLDLKLNANNMYPNFARKIYLHAYRYSLFMKPKSLLVEVGAQTNTFEEAKNAMEPLADVLAKTLLPVK